MAMQFSGPSSVDGYQQHDAEFDQFSFTLPPPPSQSESTQLPVSPLNPDPSQFKELHSIRPTKKRIYQLVDPASAPLYTIIERDQTFNGQKPDIQVYSGADSSYPLAGVVKLHHMHAREFVVGVGDPHVVAEDGQQGEAVWESLRRGEKWRHISHTFEFGSGKDRRVYTWRRTVKYWSNYVKDMELRVGGMKEKDGDLVALWTGSCWHNLKKGTLFLKDRDGDSEEVRKWEVMVVLTAMAIIENAVRRSR